MMGQMRHASERARGPTNRLGIHIRRDLSQGRQGRGARHASWDTEAMNLHLAEIAPQIASGAHTGCCRQGRLAFLGQA
jgi:hypothetical protein